MFLLSSIFFHEDEMTALEQILELTKRVGQSIIGQEPVIEKLIMALLANGNILMEGLPGLAKNPGHLDLVAEFEIRIQSYPVNAGPASIRHYQFRD
jgi:hypothetical protein